MRIGILILGLGVALLGCGSEESKMERGLVVDDEMAAPGTEQEYEMTAEERRKQIEDEESMTEAEAFDRANSNE